MHGALKVKFSHASLCVHANSCVCIKNITHIASILFGHEKSVLTGQNSIIKGNMACKKL